MHKVTRVETLENFQLKITFDESEVRIFDAKPYLEKGVFQRLKNQAEFKQAFVQWDTVCWPGELDISPATLYIKSKPIRNLAA